MRVRESSTAQVDGLDRPIVGELAPIHSHRGQLRQEPRPPCRCRRADEVQAIADLPLDVQADPRLEVDRQKAALVYGELHELGDPAALDLRLLLDALIYREPR